MLLLSDSATPPLGTPDRVCATKPDRVLIGDRGARDWILLGDADWDLFGEANWDLLGETDLDLVGMAERDLMGDRACPSVESCTTAAALTRCHTVDTSCKANPGQCWM